MVCCGLRELSLADLLCDPMRWLGRLIPRRLRACIEGRVFYAVFNSTRVTNDAYGWRPEPEDPERNTAANRRQQQS